jgi:hypothetical protein
MVIAFEMVSHALFMTNNFPKLVDNAWFPIGWTQASAEELPKSFVGHV